MELQRSSGGITPPRAAFLAFLAYLGLTVVTTWPLAASPGTLTLHNPDSYGNAWALAWVVRQATRNPADLWHANIYYPHPRSLAATESLFPEALQAAPVLLLGGSPMLAHNLVLLLTFPLSGLGAFLLARELSGSSPGAFLAGLAYGFCAYRFEHFVHVQSLSMQWFPFALLYLRRAVRGGRLGDVAAAAAFALLQALSSGYYAFLIAVTLGLALAWLTPEAPRPGHLVKAATGVALAGALTLLAFSPYREEQKRSGLTRKRSDVVNWSASWSSYLDPGRYAALPHIAFLRERFESAEPLYPGLAVLVLGGAGLAVARTTREARFAVLLAAAGVWLSLGPEVHLGSWVVPGPYEAFRRFAAVRLLRTPSRMGVLALLGVALLVAFGWDRLARGARHAWVSCGLVAFLMAAEAYPAGLGAKLRPVYAAPPAALWLATAPPGAVLELPWGDASGASVYVYWSTVHWQPLVNGWGAFDPLQNVRYGRRCADWPRPWCATELRRAGVRYVVLHAGRLEPGRRERVLGEPPLPPGVSLAASLGDDRVYVIEPLGTFLPPR